MKLSLRSPFLIACAVVLLGGTPSFAQLEELSSPAATAPARAAGSEAPAAAEVKPAGPRVVAAPAGTGDAKLPSPETPPSQLPPDRRTDAAPITSTESKNSYVIGPLDVLYVRVWGNQNLTGLVDVRPDGMMSMPLIGEMKADGTTVAQLTETVRARLEDFLIKPEVNIQVTKINSKKFYIFGEVGRQGEFPLATKLTVLDALSSAGGFRDFANPKKIYILRGTKKLPFNYKDVSNGKHMEQNIELQNGDRIFVP